MGEQEIVIAPVGLWANAPVHRCADSFNTEKFPIRSGNDGTLRQCHGCKCTKCNERFHTTLKLCR